MGIAAVLGLLVGIMIGGLGGGGGVLTVPLLVYLLGQSPQHATAGSVVVVGVAAAVGVVARIRAGDVDLRTGLTFGLLGVPAAYAGSVVDRHVAAPVLMLAFAVLALLAAGAMLCDAHGAGAPQPGPAPGSAVPPLRGTGTAVATRPTRPGLRPAVTVVGTAVAVGFLTGFLGVGGGFLVVPALVVVLRLPMATAAGTSLLIVLANSVSSVAARIGALDLDWRIVGPLTVAAALGTLLGKRVADRLDGVVLARCFAVVLVLVGLFVGGESLGAL